MGFSLATFNARDLFDDAPPGVIAGLDAGGWSEAAQSRARVLYRAKLEVVAAVVRRLDADVVAFQEVEGAHVLDELRAALPARDGVPALGYGPAVCATPDARGIACGLLSRFPVRAARSHEAPELPLPVFTEGDPVPYPGKIRLHRPVLEATVALPDGGALTTLVVHLKSPLPIPLTRADGTPAPIHSQRAFSEAIARSALTRTAEALFVRGLVDARLDADPSAQLVVVGDFNDGDDSVAVRVVAGDPVAAALAEGANGEGSFGRALARCAHAVPPELRYSIAYRGRRQQFDHALASGALWARFFAARFLNETLLDDAETIARQGPLALASDHAPLLCEFR